MEKQAKIRDIKTECGMFDFDMKSFFEKGIDFSTVSSNNIYRRGCYD